MARVLRLGILECETTLPKAKAARGSYGDIFEDLFRLGLKNLGDAAADVQLQVSKWDVINGKYPQIEDVDAIVMTGSCASHLHLPSSFLALLIVDKWLTWVLYMV